MAMYLDAFLFCVSIDVLPKVVLAAFCTFIYFYTAKSSPFHKSYKICIIIGLRMERKIVDMHNWKVQEYVMSRVLDLWAL